MENLTLQLYIVKEERIMDYDGEVTYFELFADVEKAHQYYINETESARYHYGDGDNEDDDYDLEDEEFEDDFDSDDDEDFDDEFDENFDEEEDEKIVLMTEETFEVLDSSYGSSEDDNRTSFSLYREKIGMNEKDVVNFVTAWKEHLSKETKRQLIELLSP